MSFSLERLERQLGYTFKDQELMVLALTHRSFAGRNNERLEFLGDAILNFVAGEALFDRTFPKTNWAWSPTRTLSARPSLFG